MVHMPYKMIVTDLDRTLLRSDKTISAFSAEVLRECQRRGIIVAFATARPKRVVTDFLAVVPADAVIYHNGAVIHIGGELFASYGIDAAITWEILHLYSREYPNLRLSVEIDDVLYANFDVSAIWSNVSAIQTDFTDKLPNKSADKILVSASSMEEVEAFTQHLPDHLYMELSEHTVGMIMHRDVTKQTAVRALADHYGIGMEEVAAFGDDYNDIGMLRACGAGIAVENALDEVKAAADFICPNNDEDGVAKWIEAHVLSEIR